jgi:hypothetical protein
MISKWGWVGIWYSSRASRWDSVRIYITWQGPEDEIKKGYRNILLNKSLKLRLSRDMLISKGLKMRFNRDILSSNILKIRSNREMLLSQGLFMRLRRDVWCLDETSKFNTSTVTFRPNRNVHCNTLSLWQYEPCTFSLVLCWTFCPSPMN